MLITFKLPKCSFSRSIRNFHELTTLQLLPDAPHDMHNIYNVINKTTFHTVAYVLCAYMGTMEGEKKARIDSACWVVSGLNRLADPS